jgi:hypothetical protein
MGSANAFETEGTEVGLGADVGNMRDLRAFRGGAPLQVARIQLTRSA